MLWLSFQTYRTLSRQARRGRMMNNRKLAFAFAAGVAFAVVALAVWLFVDLTLLRSRVNAQSSGSIDGVAIPSKTLAPYTRQNAMDDLRIAEHSCQSGFCHPIKRDL